MAHVEAKTSMEEELALFEREISMAESRTITSSSVTADEQQQQQQSSTTETAGENARNNTNSIQQPAPAPAPVPAFNANANIRPEPRPVMGPFMSATSGSASNATVRPAPPPPFLPHVMMRPGFMPPAANLALRFIPPQLRLPMVNFMRPPVQPPLIQPPILESGPALYEDVTSKNTENTKTDADNKEAAPSSSNKTQVLASDVEAVAQKKHMEATHRTTYIGRVMHGEKKMKRFLRCGGGQVWEDKSLAEWDPNDFRIFCGDLGNEVSDELLAKAFRKYPSFQKAKVIREARTNKSKGYGFVSFKHQDDFVRACREMDGKYVGNRPIKLRKSNWKERNMDVVKKKKKQKEKLGLA